MVKDDALEAVRQAIVDGEEEQTQKACAAALEAGVDPMVILNEGITKAMQIVGDKWDAKEYFLPDVICSADAVKKGVEFLKPHLGAGEVGYAGTVVIGTVKGDIHSIGKDLVALFLEVSGFEVYNLGEDVPAERFVEVAVEHHADIVGSSAFITAVAPEMTRIEELLKEAGVRENMFTMVGGCVLDPEWAKKIGADAFGEDAMHAVQLAQSFMAKKKACA